MKILLLPFRRCSLCGSRHLNLRVWRHTFEQRNPDLDMHVLSLGPVQLRWWTKP